MKFVVEVPDQYFKFREKGTPPFLVTDAYYPHRELDGVTIRLADEPGGISFLADIEPDWEVVRCVAGEAEAARRRVTWESEQRRREAQRRRLGVES